MARDEYYSYLPNIFKMVQENFGAQAIAKELLRIESDLIGMPASSEREKLNIQIAELLIAYKNIINKK
ncbi:MAG: hypothetical protein H6620_10675 [Halobacteriovoraceae bacterium]|nr:hypothetical protein [Halobacteriovoraceae bacterium]